MSTPRLPVPGGDAGNWGSLLNDFLSQSHNSDGTLKDIDPSNVTGLEASLAATPPQTATYLDDPSGVDDTAAIQAKINAVPSGGELLVGNRYRIDGQLNIASPMTLHFTARGEFWSNVGTAAQTMLNITSSSVHISGEGKITGPQLAVAANQNLIKFTGTNGTAPLSDISVTGITLSKSGKYGILAQYVQNFRFDRNTVKDICYGGIGVLSGVNGSMDYNIVQNITQTGYSSSYGLYTSRNEVTVSAADPRSENISICNNHITDILLWDGINTHGGKVHTIAGNVIVNVRKPIELVACQDSGGIESYAPLDMTVTGNAISSTVTNGSRDAAILLVGADGVGNGGGLGNPAEYATGTISGNIIHGHGDQSNSISAAILLYYTKAVVVTGNTMIEPSPIGIGWYHTNVGFICTGNTIIDPWTSSGATANAIACMSSYNQGHIASNALQLNGKTATIVADRGISISSQITSSLTLGLNDMSAASLPVKDTGRRGVSVIGNPGLWTPADNALIACDGDPMLASSSLVLPTAGVVYLRKIKMADTKAVTNIVMVISNSGVGLSNTYAAVFDSSGAQLGVSADISTSLQSTGTKTIALGAPTAIQPSGTWLYVALVVGGASTMPTISSFASARISVGISSSNLRWGSFSSGLSAMPATITPSSIVAVSTAVPLWALS